MPKQQNQKFNYGVTNKSGGNAEIHIYGYIGPWDEIDYKRFQNTFRDLLNNNSEITVRIHSGGGSVYEGLAIYDLMRASDATIKVVVEGMAASMGSILALGGDEIQMTENAFFMMHAPSGGAWGNKKKLSGVIDQLENCEQRLKSIYADRTQASDQDISDWMNTDKDTWLDADSCLNLGICDEVIKPTKKRKFENPENKTPEAIWAGFEGSAPKNVQTPHTNTKTMKKQLIALLAVAGMQGSLTAESEDGAFEKELRKIIDKAKTADDLKAQLEKIQHENAEALVNQAVKDGKITAKEKEEWLDDAKANYALTAKAIARMGGKPGINNLLSRDPKNPQQEDNDHEIMNGREKWDFDKWQSEDPKGLQTLQEEAPEAFTKLFNQKFDA